MARKKNLTGEDLYRACKAVVDNKAYAPVNGFLLDLFSASAIVGVADKLNATNRAKLLSMPLPALVDIVFACLNQIKR